VLCSRRRNSSKARADEVFVSLDASCFYRIPAPSTRQATNQNLPARSRKLCGPLETAALDAFEGQMPTSGHFESTLRRWYRRVSAINAGMRESSCIFFRRCEGRWSRRCYDGGLTPPCAQTGDISELPRHEQAHMSCRPWQPRSSTGSFKYLLDVQNFSNHRHRVNSWRQGHDAIISVMNVLTLVFYQRLVWRHIPSTNRLVHNVSWWYTVCFVLWNIHAECSKHLRIRFRCNLEKTNSL
jgi:hypothetical protein